MNGNPYYYGLVKQIGPWKTTRQDILRGQKPYQYTPNEQTELPYTMKAGNGELYAAYSSQGLIYDAATSPAIVSFGKVRRGKVTRAKKVVVVDSDGKLVAPTDNYFLNRYMGEIRQEVQNDILESDLGGGKSDMASMSQRASTVSMQAPSNSEISVDPSQNAMDEGEQDDPLFENLNMEGPRVDQQDDILAEEMVDRGAQNGATVLNDQIDYIQSLEQERILSGARRRKDFRDNFLGARLRNKMDKAMVDPDEDTGEFRTFDPVRNDPGLISSSAMSLFK
jgi:hypothetical protein